MNEFYSAGAGAGMDAMPEMLAGPLRERLRTATQDRDWGRECARSGWEWARDADQYYRAVSDLHPTRYPLVRVGVKDNIHCQGLPTRLGTRRFRQYPRESAAALAGVPPENITCKTQLTEVTLGIDAGCRNPLVPGGWPGASSTGSAVAVGANICDVAVGTDSLGSVRIPAVACEVVGMRMTHDPALLHGVLPMAPSLDAVGWFARTVDDLRFAMERFGAQAFPAQRPRSRPRLALVLEVLGDDGCDAHVLRQYEALARRARGEGFDVVEVALGDIWKARLAAWELCARESFEALASHGDLLEPLGEDVQNVLHLGESVAPAAAERVRALQPLLGEEVGNRLDALEIDAFVLPVLPFVLPTPEEMHALPMLFPDFREEQAELLAGYTPIASLLGWPALSFPVGGDAAFGPRQSGVQLVGRPYSEQMLVDLAVKLAG